MDKKVKREFIGDATSYQKARPNYPEDLFATLLHFWKQSPHDKDKPIIIADIGCGTGIATRGIYSAAEKKCKVIGIEPDLNMLKQAKLATSDENIIYMEGNAEKLPLDDKSVDIVMVALAMQYFDRPLFYCEAKRVLRNSGVIAIIENNRNWKNSPFLEKYEEFLEKYSYDKNFNYYSREYRAFPFIEELNIYFQSATEKTFLWTKKMTAQDFLEMVKSSTSGKRAIINLGQDKAEHQILKLAHAYIGTDGLIDIPYISNAYLAKN